MHPHSLSEQRRKACRIVVIVVGATQHMYMFMFDGHRRVLSSSPVRCAASLALDVQGMHPCSRLRLDRPCTSFRMLPPETF
jgi:hypothetical protein